MRETNTGFRAKTLALSVASALLAAFPAQAQTDLEEIQVTGTRIRNTDGMVTPTPVTAVTPDELEDFDPATTIAEQLDNLPQFLNTQTAQRGGATLFGDAAGSYLNLRNMGKQRTLVLFDGSRVVPADRASSVNVDNFPTALIRTVDVVTGGASAAYGADALAGVVNFVLDREFEGLKMSASTGVMERGDGENWNFSIAGGTQLGDRLNVIGSVEARHVNQVYRAPEDNDNWASYGWVINPAWVSASATPNVPQRITVPHAHTATQHPAGQIRAPGFSLDGMVFTDDAGGIRPRMGADIPARVGAGSNGIEAGGGESYYLENAFLNGVSGAEVVQRSGFGGLQYQLSDSTSFFAQAMAGRTESNTNNRVGGLEMGQQYGPTIYADNAFLPDVVRDAMVAEGVDSFTLQKVGQIRGPGLNNIYDGRNDKNISQMWSASLGFDHSFANGWDLRGSYQYGESKLTSAAYNILRIDRVHMALDAVRDPATGAIVCNIQTYNPTPEELDAAVEGVMVPTTRITAYPDGVRPIDEPFVNDNAIRDCVPFNVFGIGNANDAAREYVLDDKKGIRDLDQDFAELLLTGELYEGWGAGPLSFAAGLTYREQGFNQYTSPIEMERGVVNAPSVGLRGMSQGTMGGNRSHHYFSATSWATGSFDVWEWFSEVNVPVWESASGNQRFDTNFAFRQSDYSASGKIDSWKFGGEVQLMEDLRFRATKSRDVREPTFGEQFEAGGGGANIQDPQNGGISYTITSLSGGNPNLKPEEADTVTAGFVYTPTFAGWAEGFQLAVDWYEIDVMGRVGSLGAQVIIDDCEAGDQALCALITRNPANGLIERVLNVNLNVSAATTSGVDLEARYSMEPDFFDGEAESLSLRFLAGKLNENSVTTASYRDDVGSTASPEWTATTTLGYNVGPWGARLIGRYFDSTLRNVLWTEGVQVDDNTTPSQTVANLILSYSGETATGGNWTASFNVNNLFDREPPITPSQSQRGGQQGVSSNYDVFGRRYQLSVNYNF